MSSDSAIATPGRGYPAVLRGGPIHALGPGSTAPGHFRRRGRRCCGTVGECESADGEQYAFDVTISSPYDSPQRYADAFRVRSVDGTVHAVLELGHDHAAEQPFTRTLRGVQLPPSTAEVVVEARDLQYGWGGGTRTAMVPPG